MQSNCNGDIPHVLDMYLSLSMHWSFAILEKFSLNRYYCYTSFNTLSLLNSDYITYLRAYSELNKKIDLSDVFDVTSIKVRSMLSYMIEYTFIELQDTPNTTLYFNCHADSVRRSSSLLTSNFCPDTTQLIETLNVHATLHIESVYSTVPYSLDYYKTTHQRQYMTNQRKKRNLYD